MDVIRVHAPSTAHAQRLIHALDGRFSATLNGGDPSTEVELRLDSETATQLVGLFDAVGVWLTDGGLDTCQIGFGDRNYTLLAALLNQPNDAAAFARAHDPAPDRIGLACRDRAGEGNPR